MAYKSIVLARANLAWYLPLDETGGSTVADAKVGDTGTFPNGLTLANASDLPAGMGGAAPRFTRSSSQYITIADAAARDLGDTFTLVFWIKRASLGGSGNPGDVFETVIDKGSTGGAGYEAGIADFGTANSAAYLASSGVAIIKRGATPVVDTSTWHQVVYTKSGSTRHIYLDHVLDDSGADSNATLGNTTSALIIGAFGTGANSVDGWVAHVQAYSVAWSQSDVDQDYTDGTTAIASGPAANSFQEDSFQQGSFQQVGWDSFQDDSFQDDSFQSPHRDLQHQVNANAEVASGTFDVLWDPYELDALDNPEAETIGYATAKAYDATVSTVVSGTSANAEATTATWVANSPSASIAPNAGNAAATGAANAATPSVAPNAGNAAATGAASNPAPSVAPTSGVASATGAANTASGTVSAGGTGVASATGAASSPAPSVAPNGGNAGATGAANAPTATISIGGTGSAGGSAAAGAPTSNVAPNAGNAGATGAASNPSLSIAPTAGAASATGAASAPAPSVAPNAGIASATGAAFDATVSLEAAPCTDGSFQYNSFQSDSFQECPYTEANAGVASGTGSAGNASANVAPNAGSASASAAAAGPTSSVSPTAGQATATAAAFNATVVIAVSAGFASATAAAGAPAPSVAPNAALAAATGVAYDSTAFIPGQGAGGVPPTIAVFHAMPHLDASAPLPALRPSAPEPDIGPEHPLPILTATHPRT